MTRHLIHRRTALRGLGASLALPLLETMGWAESGKAKAIKPPVRLGFMYMPHGVIMDQFWPASAESFLKSPPPALASLRGVLDQCLLVKGISGVPISPSHQHGICENPFINLNGDYFDDGHPKICYL